MKSFKTIRPDLFFGTRLGIAVVPTAIVITTPTWKNISSLLYAMHEFIYTIHITHLYLHNPMQNVNFGYTLAHGRLGLFNRCCFVQLTNLSLKVPHSDRFIRYGSLFGECIGSNKRNVPNKRTVSFNWNTRVLNNKNFLWP